MSLRLGGLKLIGGQNFRFGGNTADAEFFGRWTQFLRVLIIFVLGKFEIFLDAYAEG